MTKKEVSELEAKLSFWGVVAFSVVTMVMFLLILCSVFGDDGRAGSHHEWKSKSAHVGSE